MPTPHHTQADRIAQLGASAGEKLWLALEDAYEAGMSGMANAFERALEQISEGFDEYYARELFHASAMLALRQVVDAKRREDLSTNASDEWAAYVRFLSDQHAQETADHRYEMAREMMGAV